MRARADKVDDLIFRGQDVGVRVRLTDDIRVVVVTFQSASTDVRGTGTGLGERGFGEAFLLDRNISAIHVLADRNHWYQTEEMAAALDVINGLLPPGSAIMTYGSSMGAYAALKFAPALGASRVMAISAQYSIDPRKAPFDQRYTRFFDEDRFRYDEFEPDRHDAIESYLFYDPFDTDRLHAAKLKAALPGLRLVRVPFGGHPAGPLMQEVGVLSRTSQGIASGRFATESFRQAFRAGRRGSLSYLRNRYGYSRLRPNRQRCYELGRIAFEAGAMHNKSLPEFAGRCAAAGDAELGRRALDRFVPDDHLSTRVRLNFARMWSRLGDDRRAVAACDEVLGREPGNMPALELQAALLSTLGDRAQLARTYERIAAINPGHKAAILLARLRKSGGQGER